MRLTRRGLRPHLIVFVSTSVLISVPVAPTVYSKQAVPFLSPDVAGYVGPRIVSASSDISDEELGHILELRKDYGLNDAPTFVKSLYEEPRAQTNVCLCQDAVRWNPLHA